ncbi:MAG: hypothetical protein JW834_01045 [Candidatus Diapherotrites archaeon]|nr:hypothetical protein [Candidatus Diapherotrites archaeon]
MDTLAYTYDIGKPLNIKKLAGLKYAELPQGTEVLKAQFGEVTILVFPSGEMRAFSKGKTFEDLERGLMPASVRIIQLLEDIKKSGVKLDPTKVIESGKRIQWSSAAPAGVRKTMESTVGLDILRQMTYAPLDIMSEFQVERMLVQAGENIGRSLADGSLKSADKLSEAIVAYLKANKLCVSSFKKRKDPSKNSSYDQFVFTMSESAFAAGIPPVGKPMCHFIRGLIRGAFAKFLELENVSVKETQCWGLGDTECEFVMTVLPK